MTEHNVDLFVIGAGSAGVRAARLAAGMGVRVAIAENRQIGGTCVNVGCVPKKLFVYASHFRQEFAAAAGFGWTVDAPQFNWSRLMAQKNREIQRLQGVYTSLLDNSGVQIVSGQAQILNSHTVAVGAERFHCQRILIATGGQAVVPDMPGRELLITSNDMFALEKLPERILIVGGGYIAVEFAGIMHGLGVKTTLCYRGDKLLRGFDDDIREFVAQELTKQGITILLNTQLNRVEQTAAGLIAHANEQTIAADLILSATGRAPNTAGLGLETLGVALDAQGRIKINPQYQTNIPSLYALGDVANRHNLTPVATAEATAFIQQCYAGQASMVEYRNIPTAVFSQPNIGTVGLTEAEAKKLYPEIDVYKSVFTPMKHTLSGLGEKTMMKMLVNRQDDKVLGIHMVGADAGEIIQGMAIALRAGATKAVFDSTIGIHPTAAEEFVTMRQPSP